MMDAFFEKFKLWGMYKHKCKKDQQKGVVDYDRKRKVKGIIVGGFQGKDLAARFEFQSAVGGEVILMSWKSRQRIPIFLICEVFVHSLFPGCSNTRFFIRGWSEIDLQCPGMLLCIIL
ncbi:MAG: hypothetical protein AB1Z81_08785 [Desulfotignum sp.]